MVIKLQGEKKKCIEQKNNLKINSCCAPNHKCMATVLGISTYPITEYPKNSFHLGPQATADSV